MRKTTTIKRLIAMLLTIAMVMGLALPTMAADAKHSHNHAEAAGANKFNGVGNTANTFDRTATDVQVNPNEVVRASIVLEEASTIAAGFSTINIAENVSAMNYRDQLRAQQDAVQSKIEKKLGKELDVVWNLTLAANIISANVRRGDIKTIESVDGVKSVYVEKQYAPDVVSVGGTLEPNMAISGKIDGAHATWDAGYTGEGTLIAIIDTGLDTDHQSFDNDAFLHAVDEANLKLTEEKLLEAADQLNATTQKKGTASAYYRNEKIPFGWNYVDQKADITHDNDTQGEHGSHVAGIAAANRYVPVKGADGSVTYEDALKTVRVAGNAPDAQLMIMKVFGKAGGAYDGDCVAAIEDAIILKADAVNLSLGMAIPGFAFPQNRDPYAEIQDTLVNSDTVVVFSAGNAGSWSEKTYYGYLYNDGVNYQFGGAPGSYTNSFTVASVDNAGFIGATATANGTEFGWTEGSIGDAFGSLDTTGNGTEYKFVMVNPGAAGNDAAIVEAIADEIDGNTVYITWRGGTSFFEKGNAGIGAGAAGVLVANNQAGAISMNLTGYNYSKPVASILNADGLAIWNSVAEKQTVPGTSFQYITGTMTVNGTVGSHAYSTNYYTMSNFSSWGTTGDLALKPEISAFGGSIYSVDGSSAATDAYELMSGTSMAAPQITGMSALVQQYLREASQKGKINLGSESNFRRLTQGLLMASAIPMKDADGNYYSLLQQGAGLANVNNAVSSPVYITVKGQDDGKVKAELGDDFYRTGEYVVEFDIHNMTGKPYNYMLNADLFTQAYFAEAGYGEFLDYATRALDGDVEFWINGNLISYESDLRFDFNSDGKVDQIDAQMLLDHIILGTEIEGFEEAELDVDGDGLVDTYDVHKLLNMEGALIKVGKETVHVKAVITLSDAEKATLNKQNPGGAYVEGFIYVQPVADGEGALSPELSIPVLAYYGSWTDASMYEVGTNTEWWDSYQEGKRTVGGRYPYTAEYIFDGQGNQGLTNILVENDKTVHLDGESIGAQLGSLAYWYTPIRNSGNGVVQVTYKDENGKDVVAWRSDDMGAEYTVTYYENAGMWLKPSLTGSLYYSLFNEVEVDWAAALENIPEDATFVTVSVVRAPEYYADENGDYNWDELMDGIATETNKELGAGAYMSTNFVIDPEPPVIIKTDSDKKTITVTAKDNVSIVDITLWDSEDGLVHEFNPTILGEDDEPNFEASGPDQEVTVVFDGYYTLDFYEYLYNDIVKLVYDGALTPDLYRVDVQDSAGNVTSAEILFDMEPTDTATSIAVSDTAVSMLINSKYQLTAKVGPVNLTDKSVTWSSNNPSVATVDPETGVVTAVAVGNATITATTNASPNLTATVAVEVFTVPVTATGVLGDESGYAKFFNWNFETGVLDYDHETQASETVYPMAVTEYVDGTFLAIDDDGTIYQLDTDGNEYRTVEGTYYTQFPPYDISYSKGTGLLWWTDGGYVMFESDPFNPETNGWNVGGNYGATYGKPYAVAVDDTAWNNGTNSGDYQVWVLLDGGYMLRMRPYATAGGMSALLTFFPLGIDTSWVGYQDRTYGNMVMGNDGVFYASIMTGDTNEVIAIELTVEEGSTSFYRTITHLGDFGDGVWPGLFLNVKKNIAEDQKSEFDFNEDGLVNEADAQAILAAVVRENAKAEMDVDKNGSVTTRDAYELLKKIAAGEFGNGTGSVAQGEAAVSVTAELKQATVRNPLKAIGGLNSVSGSGSVNETAHTVTVPVTADQVENGLFSLSYGEDLTYVGTTTTSKSGVYTSVYPKAGEVRIGFAGLNALSNEVVAEVTFSYKGGAEDRTTDVTLKVLEDGTSATAKESKITVTLPATKGPDLTFNGIVQDNNGIYWTEITTAAGPNYKVLNQISNWMTGPMLTTAAVDLFNETLYAATTETDDTAIFYEVDPKTFNTKEIGTSKICYTDMADAIGLNYESGGNFVVAAYGPYVLLVDATSGEYQGVLWSSGEDADGPDIVGIAFGGMGQYSNGAYYDTYYMVDVNGDIHLIAFLYTDVGDGPSFYTLSFNNTDDNDVLFSTGYSTDFSFYNSLYYTFGDERYIVWSCFNYEEDKTDLIVIDEKTREVTNLGSFEEGVWPVGGFVTLDDASNSVNAFTSRMASVPAIASINEVTLDKNALSKPMTLKGGLNSVEIPEASADTAGVVVDQKAQTVTVPVLVGDSTNGEFILHYDPSELTFEADKTSFGAMLTSVKAEDGAIHIGYAGKTALDAIVVKAVFSYADPCADSSAITLEVLQDGTVKDVGTFDVEFELSEGHAAGEPKIENKVEPDCTKEGSYDIVIYCETCGEELSRVTKTVPAKGHTASDLVIENEVEPGCTTEGSYDIVIYCDVCEEELSRVTKTVPAKGHTAGEPELVKGTPATCTEDGCDYEVVKCTVCDAELSRKEIVIPATGHKPGEIVIENEKAATCTKDGSHDEVIYCTECDEEMGRVTKADPATGHDYKDGKCTVCGEAKPATPPTGDNMPLALMFTVALLSGVAACYITVVPLRKRKENV